MALRVVIAGGGFAAAELVLALRALAEERVRIELIAPDAALPFRPAATLTPFDDSEVGVYDLAELAADCGAVLRRGHVEAAATRAKRLRLASGGSVDYDVLVIAVGARARAAVPGAVTFRDQRDAHLVRRRVDKARRRLVFAAPAGVSWTLPLYELALMSAAAVADRESAPEVVLVTPESGPLEVFGPEVSGHVSSLLARHGVERRHGVADHVGRGRLALAGGELLETDGVVAVPRLMGRRLVGIPCDKGGFVPTDGTGRVAGVDDVYAIGDVTQFPVKQGGIATQQADAVAAAIAARAGATVSRPPVRHVLRARLLVPGETCYLRAELDGRGAVLPSRSARAVSDEADWWPPTKLFGRYVTPWMAAHSPISAR